MRKVRWLMGLALVAGLGFSTRVSAFPWKKAHPIAILPPYYGYYPTQWREFPAPEDSGVTVTTPAASPGVPTKSEPTVPTETLPMPKKSLTSHSAVRGTAPSQSGAIPEPDPVPRKEIERFVPPAATLGLPTRTPTQSGPAAMLEGSIVVPERNRVWRASAPEKD